MHYRSQLMFIITFIGATLLAFSCGKTDDTSASSMAQQIQDLQHQLDNVRPGIGDIMMGIQEHHAKLWFAGINRNWKLGEFELDEIEENVEKIEALYPHDSRSQKLSMIDEPLDSLRASIEAHKMKQFKNRFSVLTQTCNNCHRENGYEFNVIKIPDQPPVPNQRFN